MSDLDEFEFVYDVFEDGTAAVSKSVPDDETGVSKREIEKLAAFPFYTEDAESFVRTAEGSLVEVDEPQQARLYAGLRALFGNVPLDVDSGLVPVKIALDSKPAIAMFLFASQYPTYKEKEEGTRSVAERVIGNAVLDVSPASVGKYFSRIGNRCREKRVGGDLDYFRVE